MRQAGILAAAGLYALKNHVSRLKEDHYHAKLLSNTIANTSWAKLSAKPETNILCFKVPGKDLDDVVNKFKSKNLLCGRIGTDQIRFVTSLAINPQDVQDASTIIEQLMV
jgi:threonine aldolase